MFKQKKKLSIPDIYIGFLLLLVIIIIAAIAELLLKPITDLLHFLKK